MYRVLRSLLFTLSFLITFTAWVKGQIPFNYSVSYVTINDGLSNNNVTTLFQDSLGYLWMGTYDGLNRYDGYDFKVYRHRFEDSSSLLGNRIVCVNQDLNKNIWIGTKEGINIQNNLKTSLGSVKYISKDSQKKKILRTGITDIVRDAKGNMWVGTEGAGVLYSKQGSFLLSQIPYVQNGAERNQYPVRGIAISDHKVWVFIKEVGLCRLDFKQKKLNVINAKLRKANCMRADGKGNLWIGTNNGLYRYRISSGEFTAFKKGKTGLLSNLIETICIDRKSNIWFGTDGGGAAMMTPEGQCYKISGNSSEEFPETASVFSIIEDRAGRIWMGTLRGGVIILDPNKPAFKTIRQNPLAKSSLVSNYIFSFSEDHNGNLWIGTDGGGLSVFNEKTGRYTNYVHQEKNPYSLSSNFITDLCLDSSGQMWLATWGGGINRYQTTQKRFKHYQTLGKWNEKKNFFSLYVDHAHNLWAGSIGGGLFKYDSSEDKFFLYDHNLRDIIAMYEDQEDRLWAGNFGQLIEIDRKKKKNKRFDIGHPVRSICEAGNRRLWVGTEGGGLLLFDEKDGILKRYTVKNGLPSDNILQILKDGEGNLWMSTYDGLCNFIVSQERFINYYQQEGIQSNQFNYNAALELQSGAFVFGGINGYTQFYPDSIHPYQTHTNVLINEIWVNNQLLKKNSRYVTETSKNFIKEITLPYNKSSLRIKFVGINYTLSRELTYAYSLKKDNDAWTKNGTSRSISFSHLGKGSYFLRIKALGTGGSSNDKNTMLKIIVLPPWYWSWWAILIYVFIIGGVILLYVSYKTRRTRLKYEIRLSQMEVKKEKELNERKLSYFTGMTHEFRTPLTLIINPLREILNEDKTHWNRSDLRVVYDNARRMLNLVDQLLYFRKLDKDLRLRTAKIRFYSLCKQVCDSFRLLAKDKEIQFDLICENEAIILKCDKDKMNIILYNLLSNAFKFTGKGGRVSVKIKENKELVFVEISDSGVGIKATEGERIFDKFYQENKNAELSKPMGFGIGLHLVKQLVEKHGGSIRYASKQGVGTTFYLRLPKDIPIDSSTEEVTATQKIEPLKKEIVKTPEKEKKEVKNKIEGGEESQLEPQSPEWISAKHSILVIEDDPEMRNYVVKIFSKDSIVYSASDGNEGLTLARQNIPDVIISDVMMEGKTGIDLCRHIKQHSSLNHIPFILMTGSPSEEMRLKGIEEGADGYITKPFSKELLRAKVDSLIKNRNNQQRYFYNQVTFREDDLRISEKEKELIDQCIEIVEQFCDEEGFTVKTISKKIGMSHSNLYRKIKKITGQSPSGFVRFVRLRKAAEYLISGKYNVNEASFQVGFSDSRYFRKQFKKLYGMNPSEFKKKYKNISLDKFKRNKGAP